ncbi:DinB family protein [Ferrovibrio xuzhouensis]|uniref:DinB family protein n=1 Tax=Ferrovibrio xuzhouensis TaxID=1576914 RepID=A0ABV7VCP6_9PROT
MTAAPSLPLQHARRFARYNRWANARVYDACAALAPEDYYAARPSFFGSLHTTLNHILVGDSIWLGRFKGSPPPHITALNQILHADFASLRTARSAKDAEIIAFCDGLDDAALEGTFTYTNTRGQTFTDPLFPPLMHFFNHQTHHRGQVHGLLSHAGASPPELDMIYFMREPA